MHQTALPNTTVDRTVYAATALGRQTYETLTTSLTTDVCVIGGGLAGCSTALHLAERGYRVVLLEANDIGDGASGRSGGQIIPGFAIEQSSLEASIGLPDAKRLWDLSVTAIDLLRELIRKHDIACDWTPGHVQVAIKPRQQNALGEWHEILEHRYAYKSTQLLDANDVGTLLASTRYCGGLRDSNGGHLHPLNYTFGLANAAAKTGVQIFEHSAAIEITPGTSTSIRTAHGSIHAAYVVVCGGAYLSNLTPQLRRRIMPVTTYVIATESLGEARARELISDNSAVNDCNFILDYFRRSADHRLLFGGRVSYSGHDAFDTTSATHKRMLQVFPQLADAQIDFSWSGLLDITLNRAPDFGRIASNIFYLQGFSGHGIALTTLAGKIVADAIAGQAEHFDVFAKIKHREFPGGEYLRTPALVLAMMWYRLRDLL